MRRRAEIVGERILEQEVIRTSSKPSREEVIGAIRSIARNGKLPSISALIGEIGTNRSYLYELFPGGLGEMCLAAGMTPPSLLIGRMKGIASIRNSRRRDRKKLVFTENDHNRSKSRPEPVQTFEFFRSQSRLETEIEVLLLTLLQAIGTRTEPVLVAQKAHMKKLCDYLKVRVGRCTTENELGLVRIDVSHLRGEMDSLIGLPRLVTTAEDYQRFVNEYGPKVDAIKTLVQSEGGQPDRAIEFLNHLRIEHRGVEGLRSEAKRLQALLPDLIGKERSLKVSKEFLENYLEGFRSHVIQSLDDMEKNGDSAIKVADEVQVNFEKWLIEWNMSSAPENRDRVRKSVSRYLEVKDKVAADLRGPALKLGAVRIFLESRYRLSTN